MKDEIEEIKTCRTVTRNGGPLHDDWSMKTGTPIDHDHGNNGPDGTAEFTSFICDPHTLGVATVLKGEPVKLTVFWVFSLFNGR